MSINSLLPHPLFNSGHNENIITLYSTAAITPKNYSNRKDNVNINVSGGVG